MGSYIDATLYNNLLAQREAFLRADEALARKLGKAMGYHNYHINAEPMADALIQQRDLLLEERTRLTRALAAMAEEVGRLRRKLGEYDETF